MIYFDNAASTPVDPRILTTYIELINQHYAHPSSPHHEGLILNDLVNQSKVELLKTLGLDSQAYRVIYTSGASEANNLFLKGAALNYQNRGKKIITSAGEHLSVLKPLFTLAKDFGFEVVTLPLNESGTINLEDLASAIDEKTILVSIIAVNNETGAITDIDAIKKILKPYHKCYFHSDVTQAITKMDLDYRNLDAFSFSAHKINGLKGSGALIIKKNLNLKPLIEGGDYEYGFRAGTPDSPKNLVLPLTLQYAIKRHQEAKETLDFIHQTIVNYLSSCPDIQLNSPENGLRSIIHFSLTKHQASVVMEALSMKNIMVATGSSCSSKSAKPSHVIEAMYHQSRRALETIRLSFGPTNTIKEAEEFIQIFKEILQGITYVSTNHD